MTSSLSTSHLPGRDDSHPDSTDGCNPPGRHHSPATERVPGLAQKVNVDATENLVQDRRPPLRVDTPVRPTDEYGRHKVACEQAIRQSRLLRPQKRGLDEQLEDMKKDFGKLVPVIRLIRPIATWLVTRRLPTSRRTGGHIVASPT